MEFNTQLLHGKAVRQYADGATIPQISQVSAFQYDSAEEQEKVFQHKAVGFAYTRVGNPTVAAFEQRVNELEAGNAAIGCSSGMSAITLALLNMLCAGDEIVAGSGLYGGTIDLFEDLTKFGITTKYIKDVTVKELEKVVTDKTKVIFGEVISNPGLHVMDVAAVAAYAKSKGIVLMIDSTTATPYLIQPLKLGANVVIHSSSKYINGGGNSISGVIVDGANFKWDFDKYQALDGYRKFGPLAYTIRLRTDIWENMGSCMAPLNAFMNTVGLETLGLRMERICKNADTLAHGLRDLGAQNVNYLTLEDNPYRELAEKQFGGKGAGGILTFRVGSKEKAFKVMNSLKLATRASNIGDVRTLVLHPASTIFIRSNQQQKEAAGVFEDTIRVSVGIEDVNDLLGDFEQALRAAES